MSREKKLAQFYALCRPTKDDLVLDVGVTSAAWSTARGCTRVENFLETSYPWPERVVGLSIDSLGGFQAAHPKVRAVRGDGCHLPFRDGAFDVVFSNAVIEHVGDRRRQARFVQECVRVARRGVFVAAPNRWFPYDTHVAFPLVHWLPRAVWRRLVSEPALHLLTPARLLHLFPRSCKPQRVTPLWSPSIAVFACQSATTAARGALRQAQGAGWTGGRKGEAYGMLSLPALSAVEGSKHRCATATLAKQCTSRSSSPSEIIRRAMDIVGAALGLLLSSPVLAFAALLIWVEDRGPAIHRRRVLGVGGREFDAFKLRTMRVDADAWLARQPQFQAQYQDNVKLRRDPRVTRVGRILRKSSIDELPQLVNVLRGDMSLVGPRMIHPSELERFGDLAPERLAVKPGITGLWQVSGRGELEYAERVELDRRYLKERSLTLDVKILLRTVPAVLAGRGAR